MTAPGLTKYGHGTLRLNGTSTFNGTVLAKWGTLDVTGAVTAHQFTSIGQIFAENAAMTVSGTGSFTANADLNIGDTGNAVDPATGTLTIQDNANVTINSTGGFFVGSGFSANTKATGTVNQTGGTLTANGSSDGSFIVGGRNSALGVGTYNLSGGTVNANTNVRVGGRGTGTVNQLAGAFNANQNLTIGRTAGSNGLYAISGGTLNQTNPSAAILVGEEGTGTLNVSGTGAVIAAGPIRVGNSGGTGTINLDGGTLTTTQVIKTRAGTATFNFNGGTLRAASNQTAFVQGMTNAYVKAGGGVVDTQAFDVTIAQRLLHDSSLGATPDGGLVKQGTGVLRLSANNTYTGDTPHR